VPYDAFSVVEDIEYGLRLGEAGHRVRYAHEAHVYGEMPAGGSAAATQRRRWETGRRRMARLHAARLLAQALRKRDRVLLDLAIDLLVPPLATLATLTALGLAGSLVYSYRTGHLAGVAWAWIACGLGLSGYALRGWQLSGTGARGLAALRFVPGYVVWKLLLRARGSGHAGSEWVRTPR
jgi:cellulose synthase/poly-beta-1,6-N-acetylglucosamine synthase-like glycosyltransferase